MVPRLVVTVTIRPDRRSIMCGATARAIISGAVAFTATEAAPLLRHDLPEAERVAALVGAHRGLPDAGVVHQCVDLAEPPQRIGNHGVERARLCKNPPGWSATRLAAAARRRRRLARATSRPADRPRPHRCRPATGRAPWRDRDRSPPQSGSQRSAPSPCSAPSCGRAISCRVQADRTPSRCPPA